MCIYIAYGRAVTHTCPVFSAVASAVEEKQNCQPSHHAHAGSSQLRKLSDQLGIGTITGWVLVRVGQCRVTHLGSPQSFCPSPFHSGQLSN